MCSRDLHKRAESEGRSRVARASASVLSTSSPAAPRRPRLGGGAAGVRDPAPSSRSSPRASASAAGARRVAPRVAAPTRRGERAHDGACGGREEDLHEVRRSSRTRRERGRRPGARAPSRAAGRPCTPPSPRPPSAPPRAPPRRVEHPAADRAEADAVPHFRASGVARWRRARRRRRLFDPRRSAPVLSRGRRAAAHVLQVELVRGGGACVAASATRRASRVARGRRMYGLGRRVVALSTTRCTRRSAAVAAARWMSDRRRRARNALSLNVAARAAPRAPASSLSSRSCRGRMDALYALSATSPRRSRSTSRRSAKNTVATHRRGRHLADAADRDAPSGTLCAATRVCVRGLVVGARAPARATSVAPGAYATTASAHRWSAPMSTCRTPARSSAVADHAAKTPATEGGGIRGAVARPNVVACGGGGCGGG